MNGTTDLSILAEQLKAAVPIATIIGWGVPLKREGRLFAAPCPFHAERTPSFYVYTDHFHCFGCGAHGDVFDWLARTQGMRFADAVDHLRSERAFTNAAPAATRRSVVAEDRNTVNMELARRIWRDAVSPSGTPVERYLQHRGVRLPAAPVIRWHPHCPRTGGALPAMVALMTDAATGTPCGIHRTYLRPDGSGKASIEKPKMMLGHAGVIRLTADEEIGEGLGLGEGIETSLACAQVIGWGPVWAAGSRGGMAAFPVLPGRALTLFADGDASGVKAARECAQRWADAGAEALIHVAPAGSDWNDVATRAAAT